MYIYTCIYIYLYIHVYICIYIHVYIYLDIYTYVENSRLKLFVPQSDRFLITSRINKTSDLPFENDLDFLADGIYHTMQNCEIHDKFLICVVYIYIYIYIVYLYLYLYVYIH